MRVSLTVVKRSRPRPPRTFSSQLFTTSRDKLLSALEAEFRGERLSAACLAEERLIQSINDLSEIRKQIANSNGFVKIDAVKKFNEKRKQALSLRFNLTVQREASGLQQGAATDLAVSTYPIPEALL